MAQRKSGHARHDSELYETPGWVTKALLDNIDIDKHSYIWEPAAGSGKMCRALLDAGHYAWGSDINDQWGDPVDFLESHTPPFTSEYWIITNPPFGIGGRTAHAFIRNALSYNPVGVAMLLSVDFDSGKTRTDIFHGERRFSRKIVLLNRIRWIEGSAGQPSTNHAWYVWERVGRMDSNQPSLFYV